MKAVIKFILLIFPIFGFAQQTVCVHNDFKVIGYDTINSTEDNVKEGNWVNYETTYNSIACFTSTSCYYQEVIRFIKSRGEFKKGEQIFRRNKEINKLKGTWEVIEIIQKGEKVEYVNECNYKEEILIVFDDDGFVDFEFGNQEIRGKKIGISNYKVCTVNIETYEAFVTTNACYNIIIQDRKRARVWYELREGTLKKYKITFDGEFITMKEMKKNKVINTIKLKKKNET